MKYCSGSWKKDTRFSNIFGEGEGNLCWIFARNNVGNPDHVYYKNTSIFRINTYIPFVFHMVTIKLLFSYRYFI